MVRRKWNNWLLVVVAAVLALSLAACGGQSAEPGVVADSTELTESYEDALTIKNQLLLGTLRLEDTDQAITSAQAQALLPLWQGYAALTTSGTAATEEIESVQNQIVETMTGEQVAAIAGMRLTNALLQEFYVEAGLTEVKTPEPGVTPESMSSLSKEDRQATRVASGEEVGTGSGSGKSGALVDMVIELLESK
ncbi:MAG: hypothetical protein JXM73_12510 [Anaerolineae bacterium]|nr:hypothetical protein [Anaerolineae bacterium]